MKKIKYLVEKYKKELFLILIIIIILSIIIFIINNFNKEEKIIEVAEAKENVLEDIPKDTVIKVDIKGNVANPGVYEMNENDRVIDVVNQAGGLLENSNTEYINLSKKLIDEMIIIIYSNADVEKFKQEEKEIIYIEYECVCPDNINDSCINDKDIVNTNGTKEEKNDSETDELVSINSGTVEDLMTLSGIGESKARAIIEYRDKNGPFKKLEDIMNVSGIGESAYSKIKNSIKL